MAKTIDISEAIENRVVDSVVTVEYTVAKQNKQSGDDDFEAYTDLFDAVRSEKDYDWMSDIFIPEFPSHMLTQSSIDVGQYFQTRDFVECYIQDESDEAIKAAKANQELINRTLNRRGLHHYLKFVRSKLINHLTGKTYLHGWWEQELNKVIAGYEVDPSTNEEDMSKPVYDFEVLNDNFGYEVLDNRNVFEVGSEYSYTIQDKTAVIVRSETTFNKLKKDEKRHGYFNLDRVKKLSKNVDTETKTETRDSDNPTQGFENNLMPNMDLLKRYGLYWYKDGKPGIDESGEPVEGATIEECVLSIVKQGSSNILIGFHKQPYKDAHGRPYRPIIRGLCYIHPSRDGGVGDGKYARELQVAINDTFNMGNDRTHLATMPVLKGKKYVTEETDSIFFEPGHMWDLENPDDVKEVVISDNINGALQQMGILTNKMQETTSIYPTTMGNMPTAASTTATAVAGADQKSNQRGNYKSLTFEHTALSELYWMITQMTAQFARPETGVKLMGAKVYDFNPELDYYYKPLSQSIETEHAKNIKIQRWTQILQAVIPVQHPNTPAIVNYILTRIAQLDGDEFANFADKLLMDPNKPIQPGGGGSQPGQPAIGAPSNQYALPQQGPEMMARGM